MSVRPKKYRKKPVEVEAVQFLGGSGHALDVVRWILDGGGRASYETVGMNTLLGVVSIKTLGGRMKAHPGDYVIRGVQGEFYPCKPDIFAATYEDSEAAQPEPVLNDANRMLIYRAYDDGDGNTVGLEPSDVEGYFNGMFDDELVLQCTEIDGVLYSICPDFGAQQVTVYVGDSIVADQVGLSLGSYAEARAYIKGLTTK